MYFSAGKIVDFCEQCNRYDLDTKLETDAPFKDKSYESVWGEKREVEQGVMIYYGAPPLFKEHIENDKDYARQEAIEKWKSVKDCINKKVYKKVKKLLEDGDGYFYASW